MTNFRALCTELANDLEEWVEGYLINDLANEFTSASFGLIDRARAALAEPQPAAEGEVAATGKPHLQDGPAVQNREPASVITEPSDEELLQLAAKAIDPYKDCGVAIGEYEAETECAVEAYGSELIAYARAVLARWGTPNLAETSSSLKPIPVSERLPEAGDCTAQGWCSVLYQSFATWTLEPPLGQDGKQTGYTHWLPAHDLPLPKEVE